jgi:hypothetical protein
VFPVLVTARASKAVLIATALFLAIPSARLVAQDADTSDGVRFDDRFFIDGQLAPAFARPEIAEFFWSAIHRCRLTKPRRSP